MSANAVMRHLCLAVLTLATTTASSSVLEDQGQQQWPSRRGGGIDSVHMDGIYNGLSLEEMWKSEIAIAQMEAERLLGQHGMSVPSRQPTPILPPSSVAPVTPPTLPTPIIQPTVPPGSGVPTPGPDSCLTGQTRDEFLLSQLSFVTNTSLLLNPSTPQGLAYLFMTTDPLLPNVCTYPTIDQRYGLATFYYATTGADWLNSQGWLGPTDECQWFGVSCENDRVSNLTLRKCEVVLTT